MFHLENKNYFALHQQETKTFEDPVSIERTFTFINATFSDEITMVLYNIGLKTSAVVMVDWDGNCLGSFMLDNIVQRIAYDERTNFLYGINRLTDKIYKFNLNGIL